MSNPKRQNGRPPMFDRPMKHVHVRLDDRTIELAKILGDGNLSEGLRRAVSLAHIEPAKS